MDISASLLPFLAQAHIPDAVERAASFGRWWYDRPSGQLVLSAGAAQMLCVEAGWHHDLESCLAHVVPDDMDALDSAMTNPSEVNRQPECEFRIINDLNELLWLRMTALPATAEQSDVLSGLILNVTLFKYAVMRERLSFESTRFLVGTDTLGDAVVKVIQLVCENLGWDWGAYWSMDRSVKDHEPQLVCQHYWHEPQRSLATFTNESNHIRMASGIGLVGRVWQSEEACWIEDMGNDLTFLRFKGAKKSGLKSGYVFPVVYVTDDGKRHCQGVLEFYSRLSRQREAQLPKLSATIGALIAQTVQRIEQQEIIRQMAQIDGLTELANRRHFHQILDDACQRAGATTRFGLMFIDLDRFKLVNDAFGHEAGNIVLREFSQKLQLIVPAGSYVGRLGGDEFAILYIPTEVPEKQSGDLESQLELLAENVLEAARSPFMFGQHEMTVSASIGISLFPDNGTTSPELLRSADTTMYRIKKTGRNASSFFSNSTSLTLAEQRSDLTQRLAMETELQHALLNNHLFLEYQPIFDADGQYMHAVEALIRWRRADGEIVRPDVFIPIAEQSQLIIQIGRWVMQRACIDLAQLHQAGFHHLQMHINTAASEFTCDELPDQLCSLIKEYGISSKLICLELTEGMLIQQPDKVIPVMRKLRQLGFGISLDDFGVGYSSLSRLKNLPISSIKIDRSFVNGLPHLNEDTAIIRTIISLGQNLKLRVIAEGVETDAQLSFLRQYGCTHIQGYVLSKPKSLKDLIAQYQPVRERPRP
ncbi:EAL domain-containing protein [Undibacterium sp. SXout7W]|uniref:EAL domain-containing protein n=1 Tax=Undibacterium sp. SXout7W TaxID=3413049 RepID=UPI003BF095EA